MRFFVQDNDDYDYVDVDVGGAGDGCGSGTRGEGGCFRVKNEKKARSSFPPSLPIYHPPSTLSSLFAATTTRIRSYFHERQREREIEKSIDDKCIACT